MSINKRIPHKKLFAGLAGLLVLFVAAAGAAAADAKWPRIAFSNDGTPISYEVFGAAEPALVFVHGWSCDARYWRAQVPVFSQKYRVVVLDLAGHGHSGMSRTDYTMSSFGEDVKAVVESTGSGSVILVGHSMGGPVIAEAASLMPERVIGLIGVDTFSNIEYPMAREEMEKMIAPFEEDFPAVARRFAGQMISARTDPDLRRWILSDISAAPPRVAVSAMRNMMMQYVTGDAARVFERIRVPVVTINGDLWPIDHRANRRHMYSFEAIVLKDSDHFLMMNRAEDFNKALEKAIVMLTGK